MRRRLSPTRTSARYPAGRGCPYGDGLPIESDYIKAEAIAGRLGSTLWAVIAPPQPGRRSVENDTVPRSPSVVWCGSVTTRLAAAETELARLLPLLSSVVVPNESVPDGNDARPQQYGMSRWIDMFSPRQLRFTEHSLKSFRELFRR